MTDPSGSSDPAVEAAWGYERLHVDALFRQWADPVLDAARVTTGDRVLDVACGTGIAARVARERVGPTGSVTGVDVAPGMLAVAEQLDPHVTWIESEAGRLPLDDGSCDAVVCQFGLMFFPDRVQAIREMVRCLTPGGHVALAVWEALERSEAYPLWVELLQRRAGTEAADALRAPFVLGDTAELRALVEQAGAMLVSVDTRHGTARFPSIRSMAEADLRGWLPVMGVHLDEELVAAILAEAEDHLARHRTPEGTMVFDAPAHIVVARA